MRIKIPGVVVGDRVELIRTDDQYTHLRSGAKGTVTMIWPDTVDIKWDDGSNLSLIPESGDRWKVIS